MSTQLVTDQVTHVPSGATVDLRLEVVVLPVSDVDRAKRFYENLGWRLDGDFTRGSTWRAVQMTPPGSPCSVHFGTALTPAQPGSAQGLYLVVDDIAAARTALMGRGVEVSEPFHFNEIGGPPLPGRDPAGRSYMSFASFKDPDGNTWLLQEVTARLPGRGLSLLEITTLTDLLRETENAHGKHESSAPKHHWSAWYAGYIVARERGRTPDEAANDATLGITADGTSAHT